MASSNHDEESNSLPLEQTITSGTVVIPRDVFESMYLNPQTRVKGQLRKTLGNPTPLALLGFLISSTCLGCALMGWRGAGGNGAAFVGTFFFFGGMLQVIGSVMEWILGNTFISVVFATYGAFWLTQGATLTPGYNAMGAYTAGLTGDALKAAEAEFYATFGFFLLWIGLITFYFCICSLRTNAILVAIFVFIEAAVLLLAAAYWVLAQGRAEVASNLQVAGGACVFVFCVLGWYLELSLLLQSVEFPIQIPVFDLSTRVPSSIKPDATTK